MKCFFNFLSPIVVLLLLQSCGKKDQDGDLQIDYFAYGAKFNWREDSVKTDGIAGWKKVANGNVFSWLAQGQSLQSSNFATYGPQTNIKTDFAYVIRKDSVFALKLAADSIYFLDGSGNQRTDVKGRITFSPDTSLIVHNTAAPHAITIKYRLEK